MAGFDGNPFVARRVEPCQTQIVPAIEIGMLAMREPPAAFVIAGTMCIRYVAIDIDGRKLHMILVVKRIGRITTVARDTQAVAILSGAHHEITVHRFPCIIVDILHDNFEAGAVVRCQVMQHSVADPILA